MQAAVLFSGGADSVLLLDEAIKKHGKENVTAIYADIRCEKTNPDRMKALEFVMFFCADVDVSLLVETLKPDQDGKGPEGNVRNKFLKLQEWCEREFDIVYLGHTKDDHIETVLIQLFRGAGKGTRGIPDYHKGKIYRPLLVLTRQEVRIACEGRGLKWYDNPANQNTNLTRVFWREQVITLLVEHYGEGVYNRIERIAEKFEGE